LGIKGKRILQKWGRTKIRLITVITRVKHCVIVLIFLIIEVIVCYRSRNPTGSKRELGLASSNLGTSTNKETNKCRKG
jgi:hypothetical protein